MGLRGVKTSLNCACGKPKAHTKAGRLVQYCADCKRENEVKWKRKNPERWRYHQRNSRLKREYGLNVDDFNALYADQEGLCAICKRHMSLDFKRINPDIACIDHNHETGNLRELLCYNCNNGLGMFREKPEVFLAAIAYLQKHAV